MKDFLDINSCSTALLNELLELSTHLKHMYKNNQPDLCLSGRTLIMIFEKMSLRTRISFHVAMTDLGGSAIYVKPDDIGIIGQREPAKDIARVIDRYCDIIMARTFSHDTIIDLARYAQAPVINALSDYSHPCQAMADMLTIKEHCGELTGITLTYIGDGNNVARSLAHACAKFNMKFNIASPAGYELDNETVEKINSLSPGCVTCHHDPVAAVNNADIIYTDTWVSMGQEDQKQKRINDFKGFAVDEKLMASAPDSAKVMHCLPAYRGYEISDAVAESENSIIFDQAENRLHFQRALLKKLLTR